MINKELYMKSEQQLGEMFDCSHIGDDFISKLEWMGLMMDRDFKQFNYDESKKLVTKNTFDGAILLSAGDLARGELFFLLPDAGENGNQSTPTMFPSLNIKTATIDDTVQLHKIRELSLKERFAVDRRFKYIIEDSFGVYSNESESWYGLCDGYGLNPSFFEMMKKDHKIEVSNLPCPVSLTPGYHCMSGREWFLNKDRIDILQQVIRDILMHYQIALTMYYEWSLYLREGNNPGFVIPVDPDILDEVYHTSIMDFDNKKTMLHFVRDHYRQRPKTKDGDYSVYVHKYLRGEHRFSYRGFYAEMIPSKYELNRVKTKKDIKSII
jgi:hypothetical protein